VTTLASGSLCALCGEVATVVIEPCRRTLVRGTDPDDASFSVTAILPFVPLCDEHASAVHEGDRLVGWCDDPLCRMYGEVGEASVCGNEYKELVPSGRSRAARHQHPSER